MAELVAIYMIIVFVISFLNAGSGDGDHNTDDEY
jgi:hypothetical protein